MDISKLVNSLRGKLGLPDPQQSLIGLRQQYTKYAMEAQMRGEQPIDFGEFVRQQQMANKPVQPVGNGPVSDADADILSGRRR